MRETRGSAEFESLLAHGAFVRRVVSRLLPGAADQDDVLQETFVRALERPPTHAESVRAWLGRVARNLALNELRGRRRREAREHAAARPEGRPPETDAAERLARHRAVVDAVLALEEPLRTTVVRRFYDGWQLERIAAAQGVTVATVRSQLRRAFERMRERLDAEAGGDREAWTLALAPLLLPAVPPGAPSPGPSPPIHAASSVAKGVVAMKSKTVVVAAVLCLLLVGAATTWTFLGRPGPGDGDAAGAGESAAAPREASPRASHGRARAGERSGDDEAPRAGSAVTTTRTAVGGAVGGASPAAPAATPPADPEVTVRLLGASGESGVGTLHVRVTDAAGGPRGGVCLDVRSSADSKTAHETDLGAGGETDVRGLPPGAATLYLRAGSLTRRAFVAVTAGETTEVVVRLPQGATVTGVVRHVEKGPLAGATVSIGLQIRRRGTPSHHDSLTAVADDAGRYRFDDVPAGTHLVSVRSDAVGPGLQPRDTLLVEGAGPVTHDIVVGRVTLEGAVRDASSGAPLPGARLTIYEPFFTEATADAEGLYRFIDLLPGTYRLTVSHDGHASRIVDRIDVVPAGGAPTRRDVDLDPAATIEIHVTLESGSPYLGSIFFGHGARGSPRRSGTSLVADEDGVARYERMPPGAATVSVGAEGYETARADIDVLPGVNVVRFTLKRAPPAPADPAKAVLTGRVVAKGTGAPVAGVRVTAQGSGGAWALTDRDGRYRIERLLPAAQTLWISKDGWGSQVVGTPPLEAGKETAFDVTVEPASTLRLRLSRKDGTPVVGNVVLALSTTVAGERSSFGTNVTADAAGRVVYSQVVPGSYGVRVVAEGVGSARAEIDVTGAEASLDLTLE